VAGRSQRNRYSLFTYATTVYACGGLWALIPATLFFAPGGYSTRAVLSVVMAGLLPLGVGHTHYNAALRRAPATSVNLIATQEITGGILLGMLFLGETPGVNEIAGVLVTLLGIALVIL
jgi:drug/metabolite transporter (DMT)-like permease